MNAFYIGLTCAGLVATLAGIIRLRIVRKRRRQAASLLSGKPSERTASSPGIATREIELIAKVSRLNQSLQ